MILKLTKNPIIGILFILAGCILLCSKMYTTQAAASFHEAATLSFVRIPFINNPIILTISLFLVATLSYFIFTAINNNHKLVEYSKAPLLLFLLVGFLIYPTEGLYLSIYLAAFCNLLALQILLRIYNQPSVILEIFGATVLIAISSILFYPSFLFILLPFLALALLRPFDLRNYLVLLISFALPFFYLFSLNYVFDWGISVSSIDPENLEHATFDFSTKLIPFLAFSLLAFLSLGRMLLSQSKFIVRQRNQLVIIYIFIALLLIVSFESGLGSLLYFILLPFALFFNYLYKNIKRKWILEVLLIALYASSFFFK